MMETIFMFVVQVLATIMVMCSAAVFLSLAFAVLYDAYKEFRKTFRS